MPLKTDNDTTKASIRNSLSAAFDKSEAHEDTAPEAEEVAAAEVEAEPTDVGTEETEDAGSEEAVGGAKAEEKSQHAAAPKADKPGEKKAPKNGAKPGEQQKPAEQKVDTKAPQSWNPAARDAWAKVPPEVRQEVVRREKELATAATQINAYKKAIEPMQQVFGPYVPIAKAAGMSPLQLADNALQLAAGLRAGDDGRKGELIGTLMQMFKVPIDSVNAQLVKLGLVKNEEPEDGAPAAPGDAAKPPARAAPPVQDPRLDTLLKEREAEKRQREEFNRQREQQVIAAANRDIEKFAEEHEFYEDVRPMMKRIYDGYVANGEDITLDQAYELAVAATPSVQKALAQRAEAEKAKEKSAATTRAKNAGSSVKNNPAGAGGGPKPKGIRSAIEGAWDAWSGRT